MHFEPLTSSLIPSACRLSTQAGWNQTEADWQRLLKVSPNGVRVWVDQSEVRASFSVVSYNKNLAWIGMVLVDTSYRGRGLGKMLFKTCLDHAHALDVEVLGLDATHMGEPIYRTHGFEPIHPIVRWGGIPIVKKEPQRDPEVQMREGLTDEILLWDRGITRVDRSLLLHALAASDATCHALYTSGVLSGYLFLRPCRTGYQLGPMVAETEADFSILLKHAFLKTHGHPVICDVLQNEGTDFFNEAGLQPLRSLQRMTLPRLKDCLCQKQVRLATGFEWG